MEIYQWVLDFLCLLFASECCPVNGYDRISIMESTEKKICFVTSVFHDIYSQATIFKICDLGDFSHWMFWRADGEAKQWLCVSVTLLTSH